MEEENDRLRKESLFLQLLSSDLQYSVLFQKFPASVGVGISGACELPCVYYFNEKSRKRGPKG